MHGEHPGYRKYIYYYGKQPEEFYDLENDLLEKNDIAAEIPASEIEQRRNDLLQWRSASAATFEKTAPKAEQPVTSGMTVFPNPSRMEQSSYAFRVNQDFGGSRTWQRRRFETSASSR